MTRAILAVGALACALGGCNLTSSQAQVQAGLGAAPVTDGRLTSGNLTSLGATNADLSTATKALSTVRRYTAAFCAVEPSLATVYNISAALVGGAAIAAPAEQIAAAVCTAVTGTGKVLNTAPAVAALGTVSPPTAYMALEPKKTAPKVKTAPRPEPTVKPGDQVEGDVIINGIPVHVNATVVGPASAK
jgi:hypothetical protein